MRPENQQLRKHLSKSMEIFLNYAFLTPGIDRETSRLKLYSKNKFSTMSVHISEKEWRDSAKQLDYVKMYGPDLLGKDYDWEMYQKIVIASLKESNLVEIFARPFKPSYELNEEHNNVDDVIEEFQTKRKPYNKSVIKRIRKIADKTERHDNRVGLKFTLNKDRIEDFIELFKEISQWNGRVMSKIECRSDGFYYKTIPTTINAANTYYVDDAFVDKIDRINQELKDTGLRIVEKDPHY